MSWELVDVVPSVIMGFCCLVGIPGNIVVMVVISQKYQPGNFSLQLMMSLAVSDLLSLLFLPALIYNLMASWNLGDIACRLIFFIVQLGVYASVFNVTLLSVQRYLQVLHTQCWTRLQASGQWALLGAIWALAAGVSLPILSVRNLRDSSCIISYKNDAQEIAILITQTMFGFMLPFTTLVCFYFYLQKRVSQMLFLRTRRTTRLVTNIVVSFSVFWVPLHLFHLLALTARAVQSDDLTEISGPPSRTVIWLSLLTTQFFYRCSLSLHEFVEWCDNNHLELNIRKTKELVVTFSNKQRALAEAVTTTIHGEPVESVDEYKISGHNL
ncbi:leukotriene B4 receptor 1-like [Alosa alosa]|uniref:leukotriene B4 receptor 1-like n=1 Tax=Alosa alosa TaxID=278164 RepID=UPI0020152099|nr:leukotriene B4 receptor 1-like [Alosa alosa]